MDVIEKLPNCELANAGPFAKWFLKHGCGTYHDALHYIKYMPYGHPRDPHDIHALLKEGVGTCFQKHSAAVHLAKEQGLALEMALGIYHLTEKIVTGVDAYLTPAGLTSVPAMHCILVSKYARVDLTAGNCNGKNKDITEFITYESIPPDLPLCEKEAILRKVTKSFFEPVSSGTHTLEKVLAVHDKIKHHMKSVITCTVN